jgi:hypothetical protein
LMPPTGNCQLLQISENSRTDFSWWQLLTDDTFPPHRVGRLQRQLLVHETDAKEKQQQQQLCQQAAMAPGSTKLEALMPAGTAASTLPVPVSAPAGGSDGAASSHEGGRDVGGASAVVTLLCDGLAAVSAAVACSEDQHTQQHPAMAAAALPPGSARGTPAGVTAGSCCLGVFGGVLVPVGRSPASSMMQLMLDCYMLN